MKNTQKLIGVINDLIKLNNDRYNAYASLLTKNIILDRDLWMLVCNLASQSRTNSANLIKEVIKLFAEEPACMSASAGLYSEALGLKEPIPFVDRQVIFQDCNHREELAQKVYYDALASGVELPEQLYTLISEQKREMKISGVLFVANRSNLQAVA
jgi:hypothetical protein